MISITRLLCENAGPGDHLRYEKKDVPRPVVVWNCTRACNLRCVHCYASAGNHQSPGEMTNAQGKHFIDELAEFHVPVILFSGGEPLMRPDLFDLAGYAREKGIRVALSTNGTLIDEKTAKEISRIGFAEVGISLDGIQSTNDYFRGQDGAYQAALAGIRNCVALRLRVSLRLTITRHNYHEIPAMLQLIEEEKIDRVCFYHLAYAGRGSKMVAQDINQAQTRAVIDTICDRTLDMYRRGLKKEILTVGSHTDGVYLYLKTLGTDPDHAHRIIDLLKINGGNNSGVKIGAVDDRGNVHPDQFWWHATVGNVLERKFGDIWTDPAQPLLAGLRERKRLLKGRCSLCRYLDVCNGNLRVRGEAVSGDVWESDPACYLTDEEIGVSSCVTTK